MEQGNSDVKITIPDNVLANIRQYQQGIAMAQRLYDTYITGVGNVLGIDFTKQYFNGEQMMFVKREPEAKK